MFRQIIALAVVAMSCASASAQGCMAELPGGRALRGQNYALAFRTEPATIAVGRHFSVDLVVCANAGAAVPEAVRVEGYMPDHRHGMNYRPTVKALGGGRFHADGLMFHMPGRWEFRFDVEAKGRTERLTSTLNLR